MIRLINGSQRARFPYEMDQMFRARAEVFARRLGWDVEVRDGWEADSYDGANPLYLLSLDERTGEVRGSLRLLPTSGPHMMRDVFRQYFDEPVLIESPLIWECTRFCIHPGHERETSPAGVNSASCELLLGICEVGLAAGIAQITGVFEKQMTRIYRRIGWSPTIIGRSDRAGQAPIFVGLWDVSESALAAMRQRSGIADAVVKEAEGQPWSAVA